MVLGYCCAFVRYRGQIAKVCPEKPTTAGLEKKLCSVFHFFISPIEAGFSGHTIPPLMMS